MKATLNASYEDARKVASCFPNATVTTKEGWMNNLIGIGDDIFHTPPIDIEGDLYWCTEEVTIDLSTQSPNIYRCMEHGLKVETHIKYKSSMHLPAEYDKVETWDFSLSKHRADIQGYIKYIKSIRILDLESYEGIEVHND